MNKETIEEAAKKHANIKNDIDNEERYYNPNIQLYDSFIKGAEWALSQPKDIESMRAKFFNDIDLFGLDANKIFDWFLPHLHPKEQPKESELNLFNFWNRLEMFTSNIQVNDPMSEEEKEMILRIAKEFKTKQ